MGATVSNLDAALKEMYLPRLLSTINENRILMSRIERDMSKTDATGRHARVPVNIRPSQAVGARSDGDSDGLPTAQNQVYVEMRVPYTYNYGTIRMTHPSIQVSRNDKGAWIRVIGSEMDGIRRDLKNDFNRQLFGDGSGVIGKAYGPGAAAVTLTMDVGHQVKVNMVIDSNTARTADGTEQIASATVTAVTSTSATIAADTWDDNAFIFRENSGGLEAMGLLGICDDASKASGIGAFVTTLQNISRSTYPEWNAQVLEHATPGTSRPITDDLLDTAILQVQEQAEGEPSLGITSATQWRKIGQLMTPDRRYAPTMTLEGGFEALRWTGVDIVWDRDCQTDGNGNHMFFLLDESELQIYQLADWDFIDEDGAILARASGGLHFDATLYYYAEFGTTDASKQLAIRDLSTA